MNRQFIDTMLLLFSISFLTGCTRFSWTGCNFKGNTLSI